MKITDIVIILALIYMILYSIIIKRKLIIKTSKRKIDKILIFIGVGLLIIIIYFFAKTWIHYLVGILAIVYFLILLAREGITEEGFASIRSIRITKWNEISNVTVIIKKDIKISILGKFREEIFHFNKEDYNEIIKIISSNLPIRAKLNIK